MMLYESDPFCQNCSCSPCCPQPGHRPCCPMGAQRITFCIVKRDRATDIPLSGARYGIYENHTLIQSAVSDQWGRLTFCSVCTGTYLLRETEPPKGYWPDPLDHTLTIRCCGGIEIDGQPLCHFSLYDTLMNGFIFYKTDGETGYPIAGAEFTLSNGARAVSDAGGLINFGALAPGHYTMAETVTPPGYLPVEHVYTIMASPDGTISVDDIPLNQFYISNFQADSAESYSMPVLQLGKS